MSEEKLADYPAMESDLRKLITLQPNNANAYNALGYSLAIATNVLGEAQKLVERATALSPSDAFIMDSLGWVKYRQGDKDQAITLLRRAYQIQPNAEIGAHLGEVLWVSGIRTRPARPGATRLKLEPDNETVLNTLKHFDVSNPDMRRIPLRVPFLGVHDAGMRHGGPGCRAGRCAPWSPPPRLRFC